MSVMKEVSVRWLVEVAEHISDNPQLTVNGFLRSGITGAFDGNMDDVQEEDDSGNQSSQDDYSSDEEQ